MKIAKDLPQFNRQPALIVAAGKQRAMIYKAYNGEVTLYDEITEPVPKYSDREGRFDKKGQDVLISGSVYEAKENYIITKFLKQVLEKLKKAVKQSRAREIYFFCPAHMKGFLEKKLPSGLSGIFNIAGVGNYAGKHPFFLLERIKDRAEKEADRKIVKPKKIEAVKILRNTEAIAQSEKSVKDIKF